MEFAPKPLTFHCREIPSWLKGQQGYSQVDELEGERVGGGKEIRKGRWSKPAD